MKTICVDLDNTLVFIDTMFVLWLQVLRTKPLHAFYAAGIFIFVGSAQAKHYLACHGHLDIKQLPYNQPLLKWLTIRREAGDSIWLITGSNQHIADRIATHLGMFDGVLASNQSHNLVSKNKARCLKERFQSFVYIGDHKQDMPVWAAAQEAGVVTTGHHQRFKQTFKHIFLRPKATVMHWIQLTRISHWSKNLMLWLPLILNQELSTTWSYALLSTFCLCVFASIGYVFNDAIDFQNDIQSKRNHIRPFAQGIIDIPHAIKLSCYILMLDVCLTFLLPNETQLLLLAYFFLSLFYSLIAKRFAILDVFVLAGLYALRVEVGCSLMLQTCLPKLTLSILFLCLSIACCKRYSDLKRDDNHAQQTLYKKFDLNLLAIMGLTSSSLGVMMYSGYIEGLQSQPLYQHPHYLFLTIPVLLYWQYRIWYKASHHHALNNPVTYLSQQYETYCVLACFVIFLLIAQ